MDVVEFIQTMTVYQNIEWILENFELIERISTWAEAHYGDVFVYYPERVS